MNQLRWELLQANTFWQGHTRSLDHPPQKEGYGEHVIGYELWGGRRYGAHIPNKLFGLQITATDNSSICSLYHCYHIETTPRATKNIDNNKWINKLPSTASWPWFSPQRFGPRWGGGVQGVLPADDAPMRQSRCDAMRWEHRTGGGTEFDVERISMLAGIPWRASLSWGYNDNNVGQCCDLSRKRVKVHGWMELNQQHCYILVESKWWEKSGVAGVEVLLVVAKLFLWA